MARRYDGGAHKVGSLTDVNRAHAAHASRRVMEPQHKGQHRIRFREGGEHAATHTPAGQPISAAKHREAAEGKFGPKAKREEQFYANVLKK